MSRPVIQQLPPPPQRGEDFDTFTAKANAHVAALTPWTDDVNELAAWVDDASSEVEGNLDESGQVRQAVEQLAEDAANDAATAQQQAQAAEASSVEAGVRRDESRFWAEQAAGELDMPALEGNAGAVLTVDDDEDGYSWQRPTIAVTAALNSADETAATFDWEIQATGTARQRGGSIERFQVQWWDGVMQDFPATADEATLSRVVNEAQGATVTARVWAYDDIGNRSEAAEISAQVVGNRPPEGPITINAPTQVAKSQVFQVSLTGATDPDGDPVTYTITDPGSFSFAKVSDITEGEIVNVTAPDVDDDTDVTFRVRAMDDKGAQTAEYSKTLAVLAAQVIGVALRATGGPGGTWEHIDDAGNPIETPSESWFNGHPVWGGMQDVLVDGQHMVEVPKFYFKRGTAGGDPAWWISDQPLAGFTVMPAFVLDGVECDAFQYGKYQASRSGGKLQSVPGVMPVVSRSLTQFLADAEARNVDGVEGFRLHHYDMWLAIQWLYLIEHATMDSQTATGQGRVSASSAAAVDASDVAQATYRGIVGLWGNVRQWMDGVRTVSSVIQRRSYTGNWVSTGESVPNGGSAQYPITFRDTGDEQWIAATYSSANDNAATLPDHRRWRNSGTYYPYVGGRWSDGATAGLWYMDCSRTSSYSHGSIGARLARVVS